jgi:dihydrolipoamide dehydrogenase
VTLPVPGVQDNPALLDSKGMLALDHVPEKLVVIGGGVIGIEFAGLFSALGTQVTVIEMTDEIIPNMDRELAPLYRKALAPVVFKLGCKVERLEGGTVFYTTSDGKEESTAGDTVLMAAGRRPVLQGWGAEKTGMVVTRKGVTVDGHMRTNVQGIWAAGDVTGLACLAHAAYRQAEIAAADIITTLDDRPETTNVWRGCVPWVVYGLTEAAGVGLTEQDAEQEAEKQGLELVKKTLPMSYSGRFMAENSPTAPGAMKVLADAKTRRILGIHAVGPYASEFIGGLGALIEMECKVEDVRQLIFPHPTVSELLRDCVWEM